MSYQDDLLITALQYAEVGLYVFPAMVERPDPTSHSKRTRFPASWKRAATRDPDTIRSFWGPGGMWRGAHVCIDTGGSALVALDADGAEGVAALEALADEHDWPDPIGKVRTPTGGQHWLYREDYRAVVGIDSDGKVATGVDVRGMGGLIFAAPSKDSAGAYEWIQGPDWTADTVVPPYVVQAMKAQVKTQSEDRSDPSTSIGPVGPGPMGPTPFDVPVREFTRAAAIEFCRPHLDALRAASVGTINDRLNDAAKALSHFIGPFWSEPDATGWLMNALDATAYDGATWQASATIASAFRSAGQDWRAVLVADPFAAAQQGTPEPSAVDALLAEMLSPAQVRERPPPVPLVMDFLDMDSLAWLIGKPGSKKSFLALDWAGHIGQGAPWRGHLVHQGEVVYVVAEGVTGMSMRVRAWEDLYGEMKAVHFLPRPVLAKGEEWPVLVEACRRLKPVLVILDTQARVAAGMEENSNTDMGLFIHQAERIREATGGCVLIVHHIGRNGEDARGASALDGAQGTEIKISRSDRGSLWSVIGQDKQKDMAELDDMEAELEVVELGIDPTSGRRLSSLRFKQVNPFDTTPPVKVPDFREKAAPNQAELLAAMREIFPTIGATYARLKEIIQERRAEDGRPAMTKQSFSSAWNALIKKEIFIKIKGAERYMINPDQKVTESDDTSTEIDRT